MNDTQTQTEHDELKDLLQHPGFLRFLRHARSEWADGYGHRMKEAIKAASEHGEDLHYAVMRVDFANEQINALLSWPKERLAQLASDHTPKSRFARLRG